MAQRENLLKYDLPEPLNECQEKIKKAKSALVSANASLDEILGAILPPKIENDTV